jgi:acylphosphatase
MRWWVRSRALELGLRGTATNRADGRVEVVAEGPPEACRRLLDLLEQQPSTAGRPGSASGAAAHWSAARGLAPGFREC